MIRVTSLALCIPATISLASLAAAQAPLPLPNYYSDVSRLDEGSMLSFPCVPPQECPNVNIDLRGTFRIVEGCGSDPAVEVYELTEVNWVLEIADGEVGVTGSGVLELSWVDGLPAQQLFLEISIGGEPPIVLDSGVVVAATSFPELDLVANRVDPEGPLVSAHVVSNLVPKTECRLYQLDDDAEYVQGCFGGCECVSLSDPLVGGFALIPTTTTSAYQEFHVSGIDWTIPGDGADDLSLTGIGVYRLSLADPDLHQMVLSVSVAGEPRSFDSGWVAGAGFPGHVNVAMAANGFACVDEVIDLWATFVPQWSGKGLIPQPLDPGDGVVPAPPRSKAK